MIGGAWLVDRLALLARRVDVDFVADFFEFGAHRADALTSTPRGGEVARSAGEGVSWKVSFAR